MPHFQSKPSTLARPVSIAVYLTACLLSQAQTTSVNLATQGRNPDFSGFPFTRPVTVGTALPVSCQVGQLFFSSTVAPGTNLYGCTAPNTWTTLSSGIVPLPQVTLSTSNLSFGNVTTGTVSSAKSITLTNMGNSFLSITSIAMTGANASDFPVSNNCGGIVASGGSCTISVTYKPSLVGNEASTLAVSGNEPGSPVTAAVSGTGTVAITSGGLVITPSATFAGENGTVTVTANRPVNWSLANGSSGAITSSTLTSATYTAPASIAAQNAIGSCQATPNDTVYNTRIDNLPVESHSATWTANMGTNGLTYFTDWGTNIADSSTPVQTMAFYYTGGYNGPFVMPQWPALKRQGGTFATDRNSTDHHILTVQKDNCQFYEIYNNWLAPRSCRDGTPGCNATSGLTYGWNSYALPPGGSTDAANLPLAPLTLHLDEIRSGVINHAVRFTVSGGYIQSALYWPSNSSNGCKAVCNSSPPYGARFRLKASFDISKFSPTARVLLTALKQYGMILADAGTGPTISTSTDLSQDAVVMSAVGEVGNARISMANFEGVDESSFIVSNNSAQVNPANGYQIPSNFAVLTATDQSNSNYRVSFPIALQSVLIGLPTPSLFMMAGLSGYQLSSWVTGTSNQNVTWSLTSGVGSVTASGLYTPPASVSNPTQTVLKVTSAADPNASASLYVRVLPIGTNPTGSIRIDMGSYSGMVDGGGNVWFADQGFETGNYAYVQSDYPAWAQKSNPEIGIYESAGKTYGNDIVYSFVVPNGNYKIRFMMGQLYGGCWPTCATSFDKNAHTPIYLEANGQIGAHNYDMGLPIGYAYATPVDAYIPAHVTNNTLYVAARTDTTDSTVYQPAPLINGLEIMPDGAAPYIKIDAQQQTSVSAGNTLQLYSVGWYMDNSVTWSISGPGAISQNGLYSAPATATASPQTVRITATSKLISSVQDTVTLTIPATAQ